MRFRQKAPHIRVFVCVDLENLSINTRDIPPEKFSLRAALNKSIEQVTQEIGPIIKMMIFRPEHLSYWDVYFQRPGLFTIACPKTETKAKTMQDTVDNKMIEYGRLECTILREAYPDDILYLCVGTGDRDFEGLVDYAKLQGFKIGVLAGNLNSLSPRLIETADRKPDGKTKAIYILDPRIKE